MANPSDRLLLLTRNVKSEPTGLQDAFEIFGASALKQKILHEELDPTFLSYVSGLPGPLSTAPLTRTALMNLTRPAREDSVARFQPFTPQQLSDAFTLQETVTGDGGVDVSAGDASADGSRRQQGLKVKLSAPAAAETPAAKRPHIQSPATSAATQHAAASQPQPKPQVSPAQPDKKPHPTPSKPVEASKPTLKLKLPTQR